MSGEARIDIDCDRDLEPLFQHAQVRALVVEQIKRRIGAGANDEIVRRRFQQLFLECAQQMQRNPPDDDGERGVLVTIASGAAFDGQVGQTAYASSKAGLVGLCLPAARELAGIGIRINTIAPGAFWTPMLESLPETVLERIQADFQFPRRFGRAEEIAALCCHIAENHFINGECIRLDGAFRLPPR